jgi:hypothetical protein
MGELLIQIQIQNPQTMHPLLTPPKYVYITTNEQIAVIQTTNEFHNYVNTDVIAFFSLE